MTSLADLRPVAAEADPDVGCRACGSADLRPVLDLGLHPLANALRTEDQLADVEPRYPLELAWCAGCSLVQITTTVAPDLLFSDYPYFSSVSPSWVEHARVIATRLLAERQLGSGSLVMEIASNDGYLLKHYKAAGVPVLGIDPARNIAEQAEANGIPTRCAFFGPELAAELVAEGLRPDVVHANNVMAHVPDLNGFVAGIAALIGDHGVLVTESPYLKDLLDVLAFDTIYHEHICYYSLTVLSRLFARHGLAVQDVERLGVHGGSLRLTVGSASTVVRQPSVAAMLAEERAWGVDSFDTYATFGRDVDALGVEVRQLLDELRAGGARIAAYGAAAKGSTLLNTFGIGAERLDFIADASPHKQGRYAPGSGLAIVPPARLLEDRPDYVLLLAWNFADEILRQQQAYRDAGGRFIIPLPTPRLA